MKFNPYHDDAGRFTTADGVGGGAGKPEASNNDGRVRVAQAGAGTRILSDAAHPMAEPANTSRAPRTFRIGNRSFLATEGQITEIELSSSRAEAALQRVRELDPEWQPAPSLSDPQSADGAISTYRALAQQAEARATVLERGGVPLGLESMEQFRSFGSETRNVLTRSGNADAEPYLRGSAVTGYSYRTGEAFDVGRRSDFDFAIVSERLMDRAKDEGIRVIGGGSRTWPLSNSQIKRLGMTEVHDFVRSSSRRDSSVVIFRDAQSLNARGPNLRLP